MPQAPRLTAAMREGDRVVPLELYFDLVFVLGFTQCTALMIHGHSWEAIGQGLLVLAVLWWTWAGYSWLTSVVDPEEGLVRLAMFAAMAALLIVALSVPEAFGDRALAFAISIGVVRAAHIALFLLASREDEQLRHSVDTLAVSTAVAVGLLVGASFVDGAIQGGLWILALAIDWGGPAIFGIRGWRLVPAHFAERYRLIIILALGESIVALGVAAEVGITAGVIVAAVLGVGLASAVWWTYFDVVTHVTERRLVEAAHGEAQNRLARDSYSYLHYPMAAGIVLIAYGLEQILAHVEDPLKIEAAFALLGGTAVYLLAHVAMRLRNAHSLNRQRLALAVLLLATFPVVPEISPLVALAILNALLWAMIAYETRLYGESRWRLRHGVPPA